MTATTDEAMPYPHVTPTLRLAHRTISDVLDQLGSEDTYSAASTLIRELADAGLIIVDREKYRAAMEAPEHTP